MENDTRENVEIDLSDEDFIQIAKLAHERDITFNQMVEEILRAKITEESAKLVQNN
jgi:hypothetical protein